MPKDAVYVGRPTTWGNPYREGDAMTADSKHPAGFLWNGCERLPKMTAADAVRFFRAHALEWLSMNPDWLAPLRGKDLACWCAPGAPCHADVLLELANPPTLLASP